MKSLQFLLGFFKSIAPAADDLQISDDVKKQNREIKLHDPGVLSYNFVGFEIDLKTGLHSIKWSDIERLLAYKVDLMTTDEICMDIIY